MVRTALLSLLVAFALNAQALADEEICVQKVSAAEITAVTAALPGPEEAKIYERYWPSKRQGGGTCSGFIMKQSGGQIAFRYYQRKLVDNIFALRADPVKIMSLSSFSVGDTDCTNVMKLGYQPSMIQASCVIGGNENKLDIPERPKR